MSSQAVRRVKDSGGGGGGRAKTTIVPPSKTSRSTTPLSERITCRGGDSINISTGKENANSSRPTSRIRAAAKPQKPLVPPTARADKDTVEPRAKWSTSFSSRPRGRSSSPSEFNRNASDVSKTRVSRVSVDRNQRSVSVDRSARVSDTASKQNPCSSRFPNPKSTSDIGPAKSKTSVVSSEKSIEISKQATLKPVKTETARVSIASHPESLNTQSNPDSVPKVSESVKLFEKFRSKSCVGLRSSTPIEYEDNGARSSFSNSSGKLSSGNSSDGSKEKGKIEDSSSGSKEKGKTEDSSSASARSTAKHPSKLHGKLAFLEEKVKRIASDIKRTKEMLDLNNPDASRVMLSDIQDTVAGIEKAMGDVVTGKNDDNSEIGDKEKKSPVKEIVEKQSSTKGLNTDELEARFFPHHKLLRDRSTLKASSGSHEGEITEVEETDGLKNQKEEDSLSSNNGKSNANADPILTANETLEDCDEEENKEVMIYVEEIDDSFNNQLYGIGHKNATGGWFVSEGESVLLAHDDSSCTFYDVANSEEKSIYKPPRAVSPNLWRDCWILRAPGADGCSGRYVVAASAGNSADSGFCSWDFYTKEIKALHIEDAVAVTVTNTRTALAPLPNNVLTRRHDLTNSPPETRQWWYKPCGSLIVSTASNQKGVKVYDIRDGEHVMRWDVEGFVVSMENSSPLQWRNRGKVVLAESEVVSLWDVGSITPEPLLSVSANGKKISALHVNNTEAELGGGVRQRVSSSEAEGNDGVFCTQDYITVLDFRHPTGIGFKIPKPGTNAHSVFSHGDSIYLGCSGPPSAARKPPPNAQIQQFSLRKQKLFTTYSLPESNAHQHYKAITQVWGDSNLVMGACGLGLFVFDALRDDGSRPVMSDHGSGQMVRETVGPDNLYCPSFDYLGSRALLISRDRPAAWKYVA